MPIYDFPCKIIRMSIQLLPTKNHTFELNMSPKKTSDTSSKFYISNKVYIKVRGHKVFCFIIKMVFVVIKNEHMWEMGQMDNSKKYFV